MKKIDEKKMTGYEITINTVNVYVFVHAEFVHDF